MIHVMFYLFLSLLQIGQQTDQPTPQQIKIAMDSGDLDIKRLIECLADDRSVYAAMPFDASVARFAEDAIVSRGKSVLAPLCNWMNSQKGSSLQRRRAVSAIRRIVDEKTCPHNVADTLLAFVAKEDEDYEARIMALSFLSRSSERLGRKAGEACLNLLNSNDPNLLGLSLIVLARGGYENQIVLQVKIDSLLEESSVRHRDTSRYGVLLQVERPLRLDAIRAYGLSPLDSEEVNLRLKKWFLQENQRLAAECGIALLQKRQLTTHQLRDLLDLLEVSALEEFHGGFNAEQHERLVFNDFVF